jgi:A/G-specific adenine glycosylase
MDYGTYLKSQIINPNRKSKHYTKQSVFEGSNRQVRSLILKLLLQQSQSLEQLQQYIPDDRLIANLEALIQEEMIIYEAGVYRVK